MPAVLRAGVGAGEDTWMKRILGALMMTAGVFVLFYIVVAAAPRQTNDLLTRR